MSGEHHLANMLLSRRPHMREGYAVVDTTAGVREAYRIVSRHRTREAAEAVILREIRATAKAYRGEYGSFKRVFRLEGGALGEQVGTVGQVN